jgi:arylsulfatase
MKAKFVCTIISIALTCIVGIANAQSPTPSSAKKPNILVIWGDDIGMTNVSAYSDGVMGYETPNIDRVAKEGIRFLQYYGEQSCTAGRAAFLTGQHGIRTGLTKVGFPGAPASRDFERPMDISRGAASTLNTVMKRNPNEK